MAGNADVLITSPANNDVLTYVSAASKWENKPAAGGGGGGTYPVVGTPIIPGNCTYSITGGFNNYTIWGQLCGNKLSILPATWKVVIAAMAGTGIHIAAAAVLKMAAGSLIPLSSTTILYGGSATLTQAFGTTPTTTAPAFITSDAIALQLDNSHDYWVGIYMDTDGSGYNAAIRLPVNPIPADIYGQYQVGNHLADNPVTASAYNTQAPGYWAFTFAS